MVSNKYFIKLFFMRSLLATFLILSASMAKTQDIIPTSDGDVNLPYSSIPEYPKEYSPGTVAARIVDGLGFRYYWATEGLRERDLLFQPSEGARTTEETINHIYELTSIVKNAILNGAGQQASNVEQMSFEQKRETTLHNIKTVSEVLLTCSAKQISSYKIIFKRKDGSSSEYPFWNALNGPIADAIWHVGQVVSFRRSSGNPFNSNVNVLSGQLKN